MEKLLKICVVVISLGSLLAHTDGVVIPHITCPEYFQYLRYRDSYIGKITLPNVQLGETTLAVRFSQRQLLQSDYSGKLSLISDVDTTLSLIQQGEPISFRVDFPIDGILPKLTRLTLNGHDLCSAREYPAPSLTINLQFTLRANAATRPKVVPAVIVDPVTTTFRPIRTRKPSTATPPEQHKPPPTQCGQEGGNGITPLIFGGQILQRGQYPWLVAIYQKDPKRPQFLCGGSLISARTVITAAHCFQLLQLSADQITVVLGRYNLTDDREQHFQMRDVKTLIMHPEYDPIQFPDADVAILHMERAISFTDFIKPICVWRESDNVSIIDGESGTVAGWGRDELGNAVSPLPKMVQANVVSRATCLGSSQAFRILNTNRTFCAGQRDGTGPCMGDSGGGLMIKRNGRWRLRGLVSAAKTERQQCNLREYVIYCDIAKHMSWIREMTV